MAESKGVQLELAVKTRKEKPVKSDISIYLTVDTSGSMIGFRIQAVISAIREIIDKAPSYARFIIRSFASEIKTIVSKKKSRLIKDQVFEQLSHAGGRTVLYDAWSETLKNIPYADYKTNRIYVLVFTDGGDSCSKTKLEEVMVQTREFLKKSDVFFTFIKAGNESQAAVNALNEQFSIVSMNKRCQVLEVEDSIKGIQFAFKKVTRQMEELKFLIELRTEDLEGLAKRLTSVNFKICSQGSESTNALKASMLKGSPAPPKPERQYRENQGWEPSIPGSSRRSSLPGQGPTASYFSDGPRYFAPLPSFSNGGSPSSFGNFRPRPPFSQPLPGAVPDRTHTSARHMQALSAQEDTAGPNVCHGLDHANLASRHAWSATHEANGNQQKSGRNGAIRHSDPGKSVNVYTPLK